MQPLSTPPVVRDLVLVGGGHSHVQVLKSFAMRPTPGIRVTLISKERESPYSGMLPGCVSGVYHRDEIHIQLDRLCRFAGARLLQAEVTGLQPERGVVNMAGRPDLRFDVLSINSGAVPAKLHDHAITVKPISEFIPKWERLRGSITPDEAVAVVGAGAGGVELAMAMRASLPRGVGIVVVGRALLPGHADGVRERVLAKLQALDIQWLPQEVCSTDDGSVQLDMAEQGQRLFAPDRVLWVTNVEAAPWLADSGLGTDEQGFIKVNRFLQSESHANVFAAGDAAHLNGQQRPKSGVYAVRAGPYLADNLRRALTGRVLRPYRAQREHLALIGTGDGEAIASRGGWAWSGRGLWHLKDFIDRRFMNKFNKLPEMSQEDYKIDAALRDELPEDVMRCGGCGAKLAAEPLRRVLERLPPQKSASVTLGIGDDAAQLQNSSPSTLLTVDGFRAMVDDPYVFGRIAAHHSLNDIFAMGAQPTAALALVTVPLMSEAMMEEDLYQLLSGVTAVLNAHDVPLVGGHSAEGAELSLGLTVTGAAPEVLLHKGGAQTGDRLILTKPLGTGVLLAAAMRGLADITAVEEVIAGMDQSNQPAVDVFARHGVTALTDVTGFGLAGHLGEMLRASGRGAALELAHLPLYRDAEELLPDAPSSLQQANELALGDFTLRAGVRPDSARLRLLADPQTSGGLLAAVPAAQAAACVQALRGRGLPAADIGEVTASAWQIK